MEGMERGGDGGGADACSFILFSRFINLTARTSFSIRISRSTRTRFDDPLAAVACPCVYECAYVQKGVYVCTRQGEGCYRGAQQTVKRMWVKRGAGGEEGKRAGMQ